MVFARLTLCHPRWMRRQSLRQYLWKWTEVVWTLFSPAVPPARPRRLHLLHRLPRYIHPGVHPRMDFFRFAPRIRRPPLSFRPLYSLPPSLRSSPVLSISISFLLTTIFFLFSSSRVRAKSTRAAATAVCPPNYAEFISYGARHACWRPLPVTFIPAVIYERAVYIPAAVTFFARLCGNVIFLRVRLQRFYMKVSFTSDSELIDRAAARVFSMRRIEEIARHFK